jgi:hypothetical protein
MWRNKSMRTPLWGAAIALLLALSLLVLPPGGALAQGGETITYGSSVIGSLTTESPFVIYTFNANAGDLISIVLAGLAPEVVPGASLLGPDQRQLGVSGDDPFSAGGGRLARIDHRIAQTGVHSLIVNNTNNAPGEFLLMLDGLPGSQATPLASGGTQTANMPPNTAPVLFNFPASGDSQTLSLSTATPGFGFLTRVFDGSGSLIAALAGETLRGVSLVVGPGSGDFLVEVGALTPNVQGSIQIGLAPGSSGQPVTGPVTTQEPQEPAAAPSTPTVCQASSSVNVNVRSGPSTDYPAFGSLSVGTTLPVVGRNSTTTWYVVDYNGRQGWVANSVVQVAGPCSALPFVANPPLPATPTPAPTSTPTGPTVDYHSTVGDGVTYPSGTCFTFYWTVTNVQSVFFDGMGVAGQGQAERCPTSSRSYVLHVVYNDGSTHDFSIPVGISP